VPAWPVEAVLLYAHAPGAQAVHSVTETGQAQARPRPDAPRIIPRAEHNISRADISKNALKVLYRLRKAGYQAYLVGGGVRDLLLGREPKDFDVATDARPEEVRALFRNCRLIGRRFRLAHVHFGPEIIEVATFRAIPRLAGEVEGAEPAEGRGAAPEGEILIDEEGRIVRDNVYGTIEEDAWRRDFTVNALYYNIADFSVLDYVGGMEDLRAGLVRLIGDPEQRYREDPVRMLRAVRFAAKLGFRIDPATAAPIRRLGHLLEDIPPARLFEEVLKLFLGGAAVATFELLRHYDLFRYLFPATDAVLADEEDGFPHTFVLKALANTDARIAEGKPVTPAFLYAVLLWGPVRRRARERVEAKGAGEVEALHRAASEAMAEQIRHTALPKRFRAPMREIWTLQPRFEARRGRRPLRLRVHPRYRAAYDFMLLRAEAGEVEAETAEWWHRFEAASEDERERMLAEAGGRRAGGRRRRRRRPAPAGGDAAP